MRNFGYDVSVGMEVGKAGQLLGRGVFGQFSLVGNRVAALHLATRVFLDGKICEI